MKTKKELKEEYKNMKFKMGVFRILNLKNGKFFIGSAANLDAKWNMQKTLLANNLHVNSKLQNDWNEFGESNFVYEIVDTLKHDENDPNKNYSKEIKELEKMYLEELGGEKCYNTKS